MIAALQLLRGGRSVLPRWTGDTGDKDTNDLLESFDRYIHMDGGRKIKKNEMADFRKKLETVFQIRLIGQEEASTVVRKFLELTKDHFHEMYDHFKVDLETNIACTDAALCENYQVCIEI